jgi:hypothetical protein
MHVCGVAGDQHPSLAVGRGLPRCIGEPGDPDGAMDPVVRPACGDESLAEIAQGGFGRGADMLFGYHDSHRSPIRVDDLAVDDLVLLPAEGMDTKGTAVDAPFGCLGHLDLSDQVAGRRIRSRERDARGLADETASAIAPDEILRPQRPAVAERDIDAGVVLCEAVHLDAVEDGHSQFADPASEDALDVVLPQPEPVIVPGGEVADVQDGPGEPRDLSHLSLREEPLGDSALIEDFDRA